MGSGNEKIAYRLLGFDQQESSSPSGVYPSYAFANNDTEVIVWAKGGKLVRCVAQHSATLITNIPVCSPCGDWIQPRQQ